MYIKGKFISPQAHEISLHPNKITGAKVIMGTVHSIRYVVMKFEIVEAWLYDVYLSCKDTKIQEQYTSRHFNFEWIESALPWIHARNHLNVLYLGTTWKFSFSQLLSGVKRRCVLASKTFRKQWTRIIYPCYIDMGELLYIV